MSTAPAGWHPDPTNPQAGLRYWDGSSWTQHTHPVVAAAPAAPAAPFAPPVAPYPTWSSTAGPAPERTLLQRNRFTAITLGFVLLYVVLAFAVHIVLLGILPVVLSVRAFRAKEPLAPLAAVLAGGAVVFGLMLLS